MTYLAASQSWFQTGSRRRCGLRQWNKRWNRPCCSCRSKLKWTIWAQSTRPRSASRLPPCWELPLSAISLDLGTSRRRLDRVRTTPVHRRLTTRQFTVLIVDEATVNTATAAALAAQWSNSSPLQLSAALGINVTSASAPVVTTQTRIQNVTVSTMTVVDCPPGFWGANGECVACAKGTYRSGQGNATGCLECPAGTYQPSDGGSECLVCGAKLAP